MVLRRIGWAESEVVGTRKRTTGLPPSGCGPLWRLGKSNVPIIEGRKSGEL